MPNTDIPVGVGALSLTGQEVLAGTGTIVVADCTTELRRKMGFFDTSKDQTTLLRTALDKAWRMSHNRKDLNAVYRDSYE